MLASAQSPSSLRKTGRCFVLSVANCACALYALWARPRAPVAQPVAVGAADAPWRTLRDGWRLSFPWPLRLPTAPVRGVPALSSVEELRPVARAISFCFNRDTFCEVPCLFGKAAWLQVTEAD